MAEVEYKDAVAAAELAARRARSAPSRCSSRPGLDYAEAQTLDRAAALRAHLTAGDALPGLRAAGRHGAGRCRPGSAVQAAEATGKAARAAAEAARGRRTSSGTRWPASWSATWSASAPSTSITCPGWPRCAPRLADSPGVEALQRRLAELARLQQRLDDAGARGADRPRGAAPGAARGRRRRRAAARGLAGVRRRPRRGGPVRAAAGRPGRPGRRLGRAGRLGARPSADRAAGRPGRGRRGGAPRRTTRRSARTTRSRRCSPPPG